MSDTRTWLPLFPRDFLADTGHLTCEQTGAYLLLLMRSWMVGPLPVDDAHLARVCRVSLHVWNRRLKDVLLPFFTIDGTTMTQKRLENERARASRNVDARKTAASARWQKRKGSADANAHAEDKQTASPPPSTYTKKSTEEQTTVPPPHRAGARAQAPLAFGVPDWIPAETWEAYLAVRRRNRAQQTEYALNAIISELDRLRALGHAPKDILDNSIRSGWSGVFAPKGPRLAVSNPLPTSGRRTAQDRRYEHVKRAMSAGLRPAVPDEDEGAWIDGDVVREET